jgi:hypothetical protein
MTDEFQYKSSSQSTVEAGFDSQGQGWSSNGFVSVTNGTSDTNIQTASNSWGKEIAVPLKYEEDNEVVYCNGGGAQTLWTRAFPLQSYNGFTIEADTSGFDGPYQYHSNYADPPRMVNMLPGEQWSKDKSSTQTYSAAVTFFGFTAKSQSVWSTQLEDHWTASAPKPYASNQDPYHLWGSNGQDVDSAQNIYAFSGADVVTGQGSLANATFNYTNSVFSTSCAGNNTWNLVGTAQPLTLRGDLRVPVFTGAVNISATGSTTCTNLNNETGSFTLNSLTGTTGTQSVSCQYPYGSSGTYTRAGNDVTASGPITCTVNGVSTPNETFSLTGHWAQNLDSTTGTLSGSMSIS